MEAVISDIVQKNISAEAWNWLQGKADVIKKEDSAKELNASFAIVPRKVGKNSISVSEEQKQRVSEMRKGLSVSHWTVDRLCRVWLLLQPDAGDKNVYLQKIDNLFSGAEMNELISLYTALPLLAFPESWRWRCTEGIRNNIGGVFASRNQ
jgi:hypothetical protein